MFGDYERKQASVSRRSGTKNKTVGVVGESDDSIRDGTVCLKGYKALNVRKFPSLDAAIVGTLYDGDAITIYENESTVTFFKIRTVSGIEGYSLREQIKMEK